MRDEGERVRDEGGRKRGRDPSYMGNSGIYVNNMYLNSFMQCQRRPHEVGEWKEKQ